MRALVVDDSAMVREILSRGLSMDPDIDVVGTASDPYMARDLIQDLLPDVLTLDVEMPRMDGVEFLRRLMPQYPLPVVMVSALTRRGRSITLDALEAGAVDFVTKPSAAQILERRALDESTDKVIAIGASTGGTEAIREVVTRFPANMPGTVIVQHMPADFTRMFAERLDGLCAMSVKEAEHGDRVMAGHVLVAPGGLHMSVIRSGSVYRVRCSKGESVCGHCPSVEVLMQSVAKYAGKNALGIMLTGMGHDGADGMAAMREAGARALAQDEETSIVFGMPKEAFRRGGAEKLVPLTDIAAAAVEMIVR